MSHAARREEHTALSFVFAVLIHGIIAAMLYFGIHWQTHSAAPVQVEMWSPPPPAPVVPPPRVVAPPKAVVEPTPEPTPTQTPDIELEAQRKAQAQKKPTPTPLPTPTPTPKVTPKPTPTPTPTPKVTPKPTEPPKKTDAKAEPKLDVNKAFDLKSLARDQGPNLGSIAALAGKAEAGDKKGLYNQWATLVQGKVRRNISYGDEGASNPEVIYQVTLLPDMTILSDDIKLIKSSGVPTYDDAVRRAIVRTNQFPPLLPGMEFSNVRTATLRFKLHD
ncbi:MAG: TonB C-terminal domain-containing protein [Burkholderiales bacterium]|nr:TonB C-terminal domain-containing protein [Burkholderiales bacterium]